MIVSAISTCDNCKTNNSGSFCYNMQMEQIGDTSFNSLTPYSAKKVTLESSQNQLLDNINSWKNFCQKQILGQKLDITA